MSDLKMPDVNSIIIAGNLINDPVPSKTPNGTSVAHFTIASIRKYRDNSGIWRENICHVGVVAWHGLADFCQNTLQKKHTVIVEGDLVSRPWREDDANNRSVVEIRCRRLQILNPDTGVFVDPLRPFAPEETAAIKAVPATPSPDAQKPDVQQNDDSVDPTDFDFGYQDLKL